MSLEEFEVVGTIHGHVVTPPMRLYLRKEKCFAKEVNQLSSRDVSCVEGRVFKMTLRT